MVYVRLHVSKHWTNILKFHNCTTNLSLENRGWTLTKMVSRYENSEHSRLQNKYIKTKHGKWKFSTGLRKLTEALWNKKTQKHFEDYSVSKEIINFGDGSSGFLVHPLYTNYRVNKSISLDNLFKLQSYKAISPDNLSKTQKALNFELHS